MTKPSGLIVAYSHGTAINKIRENHGPDTQLQKEPTLFEQIIIEDATRNHRKGLAWYSVRLCESKSLCGNPISEY